MLFEAPRREITSIAVGANGTIYAACVGDKSHNPLPPLPVQGVGTMTITIVQPGSLQAANTSTSVLREQKSTRCEGQAPRKLWAGKDEIVYALAARPDGLLALTGNRGRIFRIADDGSYADIAHLDAQQGLSMAVLRPELAAFSSVPATPATGRWARSEKHEYASDVLDAGAIARFGRVEVEPVHRLRDFHPHRQHRAAGPRLDRLAAAQGRRRRLAPRPLPAMESRSDAGGVLGSVGVNYLPVNTAPVVDEMVVVPGARLNPQRSPASRRTSTSRFPPRPKAPLVSTPSSSSAPAGRQRQDRDDRSLGRSRRRRRRLIYSLYLRGDGETFWRLLKDKITDKAYSFDAMLVPDGGYQIKVVASDSPSQPPATRSPAKKSATVSWWTPHHQ